RRSGRLRDRDDRHAVRGSTPAALRRARRPLDPGLLVGRGGALRPGDARVPRIPDPDRAARQRDALRAERAPADRADLDLRHRERLADPVRPGLRALHLLPPAHARHLHAGDRLRRRGPRLDLELQLAGLADRGRRPAPGPARPARPGTRGDRGGRCAATERFALTRNAASSAPRTAPKRLRRGHALKARLRIGEKGAVELDGRVEERHRGRSYALLRTPAALLLGVDELRELPESHQVLFAGDLARIAFSELVSLIVHGRISGVLRVYGSSAARTVVFSAGEVRGAYSDRVSERLGEIAVRLGMIKREDMEELVTPVGDPRRAGRLAVERRLLSERNLWKAVQEHVTTVFQAILLETRG